MILTSSKQEKKSENVELPKESLGRHSGPISQEGLGQMKMLGGWVGGILQIGGVASYTGQSTDDKCPGQQVEVGKEEKPVSE